MKRFGLFIFSIFICFGAIAQTETTQWYIDGELYDTTTCESGGNITMPQTPERFGYTFAGWEPAVYDMSTLDATINGVSNTYDNSVRTWHVMFSYGDVYGESVCSTTPDNEDYYESQRIDTSTQGTNCWCRVTGFMPANSDRMYDPVYSFWAWSKNLGYTDTCRNKCAEYCASSNRTTASFRGKLYGIN